MISQFDRYNIKIILMKKKIKDLIVKIKMIISKMKLLFYPPGCKMECQQEETINVDLMVRS